MDLKELKKIWENNGFRPTKRLGQNFLIDKNVRDKILSALSLSAKENVVEIGPGFGVMTFELAERCARVFAVEKDLRVCDIMEPLFVNKGNITLIRGDILEADLADVTGKGSGVTVFGNIPYYISTPVITRMIEQRSVVESVYIVMQEELADRLVSPPGSRVYGSLSCFVQYYAAARKLFRIKATSFYPRPKVGSCMLELKLLSSPSVKVKDEALMFAIIRRAFSQRRKKMLNPLLSGGFPGFDRGEWEVVFTEAGIDTSSRAEALSLIEYAALADAVSEHGGRSI